jgi:hypothetical protein
LNTTTSSGDEPLDGGSIVSSSKFLLSRLLSRDDRDSEQIRVDPAVEVEDGEDLLIGFGLLEECSVSFLPEEFTGTKEWLCVCELHSLTWTASTYEGF